MQPEFKELHRLSNATKLATQFRVVEYLNL